MAHLLSLGHEKLQSLLGVTIGDQSNSKKIVPLLPAEVVSRVPDYVSFTQFSDSTSSCLHEVRDDGFAFLDLEWEPHTIDYHLKQGVSAKARSLTWNELIRGYHEQTISPTYNDSHVFFDD